MVHLAKWLEHGMVSVASPRKDQCKGQTEKIYMSVRPKNSDEERVLNSQESLVNMECGFQRVMKKFSGKTGLG